MEDFDFQVRHLSSDFYNDYPLEVFHELLDKDRRSYNCLLIQSKYDYFICIPYRSEIRHRNAFKFRNTIRSSQHSSGLDYSKMVIVKNKDYLSGEALVDDDEYKETVINISRITEEANKYIDDYINHYNGTHILHDREFDRKYKFSTLMYFHNELNISVESEQ